MRHRFNAENAKLKETRINLKFIADYPGKRREFSGMKQTLPNSEKQDLKARMSCSISPCVQEKVGWCRFSCY